MSFNNKYKKVIEDNGMTISGINDLANLVEIVEIKIITACRRRHLDGSKLIIRAVEIINAVC